MKLRISGLLAIAAFVSSFLASAQTLAQNAYITNVLDNTVSVIATAMNTLTATIPVGFTPAGVAVAPDGSQVYVANQGDQTSHGETTFRGFVRPAAAMRSTYREMRTGPRARFIAFCPP